MKQIILSAFTAPNGANPSVHRIESIEIGAGQGLAVVSSFQAMDFSAITWQDRYPFPLSVLTQDAEVAVANWLVSNAQDAPFKGGTVLDLAAVPLEQAKTVLRQAVKAKRDAAEWGGVTTPSGVVDSMPDSQRKISGAVTMALIAGEAFTVEWRMADNSIVTLDRDAMVAIGVLVGQHVAACQARKNALDAAIQDAVDEAELEVIDINSGWPQ